MSEKFGKKIEIKIEKGLEGEPEEIGYAEKAKVIKGYIEAEYVDETQNKEEEVKELFSKMDIVKLQEIFGKEGFELVYNAVNKWNQFSGQIKKEMPPEEKKEEFVKKYGYLNMPKEIEFYSSLKPKINVLPYLYDDLIIYNKNLYNTHFNSILEKNIKAIEKEFNNFKDRKRKDGPIKIMGFENLDLPKIKGKEIAERVLSILPNGTIADLNNLKSLRYVDEPAEAGGGYDIVYKEIKLYRTENNVSLLPPRVAHEYGHTIDPRFATLKSLTLKKQLSLIEKWEGTRKEEPLKISFYCASFEEYDKKDTEGYAESVRRILTNPLEFRDAAPKRYEFFISLFKKLYPEFTHYTEIKLHQNMEKMKEYDKLLFDLGYTSMDSALKSVEKEFKEIKEERKKRWGK